MTETEPTNEFLMSREEYARFVESLLELAGDGFILTTTTRVLPSGEFSVSAVTLRSEGT